MQIPCPSCREPVELKSAPIRGHSSDGSDAWVCLKCASIVCIDCYHEHTRKQHPEAVQEIKKRKK